MTIHCRSYPIIISGSEIFWDFKPIWHGAIFVAIIMRGLI